MIELNTIQYNAQKGVWCLGGLCIIVITHESLVVALSGYARDVSLLTIIRDSDGSFFESRHESLVRSYNNIWRWFEAALVHTNNPVIVYLALTFGTGDWSVDLNASGLHNHLGFLTETIFDVLSDLY